MLSQKLGRGNARHFLEHAGKMVREVKSKQAGSFIDVVSVHQEVLSLVYDKGMDVADGRASCSFVDDIPQISRRIGQVVCAVFY